ncbi:MAG: DUF3800 domain-containing protein [Candidatus Dormiibacterota bacterium]
MYLLYLDDSGQASGSKPRSSRYFVLGGLALHEEDCYPFTVRVDQLQQRLLPTAPRLELHASAIWAGREEWGAISRDDRHALLDAIFHHLAEWVSLRGTAPVFFACAIEKKSFMRNRNVQELAHEEVFGRVNSMMRRLHLSGDSHRLLVIADDSSYEKLLQALVPQWKSAGSRISTLDSLIEVPLYVDSRASRLVQAADFVAWAVAQEYENGQSQYLNVLQPRFDHVDPVQHGLVHMVSGYKSCPCHACRSRAKS